MKIGLCVGCGLRGSSEARNFNFTGRRALLLNIGLPVGSALRGSLEARNFNFTGRRALLLKIGLCVRSGLRGSWEQAAAHETATLPVGAPYF